MRSLLATLLLASTFGTDVVIDGFLKLSVSSATTVVAPVPCDAAHHGVIFIAHDTDAASTAGKSRVCVCGDDAPGVAIDYQWINITPGTATTPCP